MEEAFGQKPGLCYDKLGKSARDIAQAWPLKGRRSLDKMCEWMAANKDGCRNSSFKHLSLCQSLRAGPQVSRIGRSKPLFSGREGGFGSLHLSLQERLCSILENPGFKPTNLQGRGRLVPSMVQASHFLDARDMNAHDTPQPHDPCLKWFFMDPCLKWFFMDHQR